MVGYRRREVRGPKRVRKKPPSRPLSDGLRRKRLSRRFPAEE
jgi:hypothetical protein